MQPLTGFFNTLHNFDPLPASTVQSIVNRQRGTVDISARFRVVDNNFNRIPVVIKPSSWNTARFGAFDPTDISLVISTDSSVNHDSTRAVHRQTDFTMIDPKYVRNLVTLNPVTGLEGFPFNPFYNFLEISQVYTNHWRGQSVSFEVPLGYYIGFLPSQEIHPDVRYFQWTCLDLMALVAQTPLISDWVVYKDYPGGILGAMKDILVSGSVPISLGGTGITPVGNDDAGPAIPAAMIDFSDASGNLPVVYDIPFQAGTSRVDMLNTLAGIIQYTNVWVRTRTTPDPHKLDTKFTTRPIPFSQANNTPSIGWDYSTFAGSSIIESPIAVDFTNQGDPRIANLVKVEGSPSNAIPDPITGIRPTFSSLQGNFNPNSAISLLNFFGLSGTPRAITKYQREDKLTSTFLADAYGNLLLQQGEQFTEQARINSMQNALHEDNEVLVMRVTVKEETLVPSSEQSPFIETAFTLPLKSPGGRMSHQISRLISA